MRLLVVVLTLNLVTSLCATNPYDPGICASKNRGKIMVIKDRQDDDKIVACVQHHGKYQWDMINGYSYGNYFDPARDCSHVIDKIPNAKNGVYWIQTNNKPNKAWCDVDTDGGGFMLIGVKDTPKTWAIPSNFTLVHPHGDAAWSCAFGAKKVLDFRVQISTSKDFHDTRSHWYYRFQSRRYLSKLLMSDKGGCSHQYPGIGDVAYVKDLMTRKITTRNFQCSRFGAAISPGLGWDKMNRCFKEPCPGGFAFIYKYHIDRSGSYSYSVVSPRSGIQNSQTSFIGCDHGECCACFGPDSKKDYCAPRCKAINGGTVLREKDKITVWFWIRSSLPKRVWKRCMEFKVQNNAGKLETWHVQNEVKGRGPCSNPEDAKINDGVVVVPNNKIMSKLPKVEGLLSYRSDDSKLYLKEKSRWKALAIKEEVTLEVDRKLKNINQKMSNELTILKEDLKVLTHESCRQIWMSQSNKGSGVYQISVGRNEVTNVYCQMTSVSGCSGGGWTMVMKVDGSSSTFRYRSSYWTNTATYQDYSLTGFDNRQLKGSTYWRTSFKEICVAMKSNGYLRATSFWYPASSLYSLIADGKYRATNLGRWTWKRLIYDSSLQYNCRREGFNAYVDHTKVGARLGIIANQENDCITPDSFLGFGATHYQGVICGYYVSRNTAGNVARCGSDNGNKNAKVMGYILVR